MTSKPQGFSFTVFIGVDTAGQLQLFRKSSMPGGDNAMDYDSNIAVIISK